MPRAHTAAPRSDQQAPTAAPERPALAAALTSERVLALQRTAGNQAVGAGSRELRRRRPPMPSASEQRVAREPRAGGGDRQRRPLDDSRSTRRARRTPSRCRDRGRRARRGVQKHDAIEYVASPAAAGAEARHQAVPLRPQRPGKRRQFLNALIARTGAEERLVREGDARDVIPDPAIEGDLDRPLRPTRIASRRVPRPGADQRRADAAAARRRSRSCSCPTASRGRGRPRRRADPQGRRRRGAGARRHPHHEGRPTTGGTNAPGRAQHRMGSRSGRSSSSASRARSREAAKRSNLADMTSRGGVGPKANAHNDVKREPRTRRPSSASRGSRPSARIRCSPPTGRRPRSRRSISGRSTARTSTSR